MSECFIGEIRLFGGTFAPLGWAFCNGALLPISEYDALFALIGTTYGGDGQTTFALPDLRGRVAIHQGQGPGLSLNVIGQQVGVESVTLTSAQAGHTHTLQANSGAAAAGDTSPAARVPAALGAGMLYTASTAASVAMAATMVGGAGGSQPHENVMPSLVLNYIIAIEGIFPSRN